MKCDICGVNFTEGNRPDGIPNGISMVQKGGKRITVCADCIIRMGEGDRKTLEALESIKEEDDGV